MQFKESFIIDKLASAASFSAYPMVDNWKFQGVDCCSWDGIGCDQNTGHVIGLDLSSSCLYGSINSSSGLFHLVHLQTLNLAYNDFNNSVIPSALSNLWMLTYLNLSHSVFSGQIPSEISELHKLSSLDLESSKGLLELKIPDLKSLIRNLTNLKYRHLSGVNVAFPIPSVVANFSSLTSLRLEGCGLLGKFPLAIFQLPNLQTIWVIHNSGLTGLVPSSLGNLTKLYSLNLKNNNFTGSIPSELMNLTQLTYLNLMANSLQGSVPSSIGDFRNLNIFTVRFDGEIPKSIGNLKELQLLNFSNNNLVGRIPLAIAKLTNLEALDLSQNKLARRIPWELSKQLTFLEFLNVFHNHLTGPIPQY
ncbi:hypothetical protein DITRI_Ditri20bG0094300 [Diplodiscus trichospermus]